MFDWLPPGVELQEDVTVADWIVSALEPWGADGFRLENLLPGGFDHYVRVFHPVEEWNGSESVIRSWTQIGAEHGVSLSPEVSFAEVVGFEGDNPESLDALGPQPGKLPTEVCRVLASVLARYTTSPADSWFGLWSGWGILLPGGLLRSMGSTWKEHRAWRREMRRDQKAHDIAQAQLRAIPQAQAGHGRDYLIFHGPLEAASSLEPMEGFALSPSLWWPDDRAWVVGTEIDGLSTYVGGSREAIGAIIDAPGLEAIEVTRDMLVD